MAIQEKTVQNHRVYYDDRYNQRWIDVIGPSVTKFDLNAAVPTDDTTGDPTAFTMTVVEAGTGNTTCVNHTTQGKGLLITTAANEYDGINLQLKGSKYMFSAGYPIYFGIKASVQNATKCDMLVGLCEVDSTLMATSSSHALAVTDDGEYFYKLAGGTTLYAVSELGGTESSATLSSALDTEYHVYEIYWDGASLYFYFDDSLVATHTSGIADQALTPSLNFRAHDDGAEIMNVEWWRAFQIWEA